MKKTFIITMAVLVLLSSGVMADSTQIRPVNIKMSIDFTENTAFKLILPGGTEKYYSWGPEEVHTDEAFNHTIYYEYDEAEWCSSYSDITQSLNSINGKFNQTIECADAKAEKRECLNLKENEEKLRIKYEAEANRLENKTEELKEKYETCSSSLNSLRTAKTDLNTCSQELDDCEKKNQNTMIFAFLVGIGAGYFIWGRKNKGGPSEQSEAGAYGDEIDYRDEEYGDAPFE